MESANESLDGSRCTIILCKERIEEYGCSDSGHEHYCRHERSVRRIVRSKVGGSKFIILLACGVQKGPLSLTATQLVRATLTR